MPRLAVSNVIAIIAGIAAVYLLPSPWLPPFSAVAAIGVIILAVIVKVDTKTETPVNPVAGALLLLVNLPQQPLAKVEKGWALTTFLALAAFLISLALAVMVRANA